MMCAIDVQLFGGGSTLPTGSGEAQAMAIHELPQNTGGSAVETKRARREVAGGVLGRVLAAPSDFQAPAIPVAFFDQKYACGTRFGSRDHRLFPQGGKVAVPELHSKYPPPSGYGGMQEFCTCFQSLILESRGNLPAPFDLVMLVIVVAHAHFEFLKASDGLVQLT